MEGRWTLPLFLGAYLVLLASEVRLITGQGIYTNTWAVHIEGGAEEAERIAQKHGFISHGQVSGINALSKIHLLFLVRVAMFVYVDIMLPEVCSDVLVHHSPSCCQALLLYTRGRQICTNTHAHTIATAPPRSPCRCLSSRLSLASVTVQFFRMEMRQLWLGKLISAYVVFCFPAARIVSFVSPDVPSSVVMVLNA